MNDYLKTIEETYEPYHKESFDNEPKSKLKYLFSILIYFSKDIITVILLLFFILFFKNNTFFFKDLTPADNAMESAIYDVNSFLLISEDDYLSSNKNYHSFFYTVYEDTLEGYMILTHKEGTFYLNNPLFEVIDNNPLLREEALFSILDYEITSWNNKSRISFYIPNDINYNLFLNSELKNNVVLIEGKLDTPSNDTIQILSFLLFVIITIPIIFLLKPAIKDDFYELKEKKYDQLFGKTITGVLILMAAGVIGNLLSMGFNGIFNIPDQISLNQLSIEVSLKSPFFILMVISVITFGPIVEELVFRKSIFGVIKNERTALIVSALIFGGIHVAQEFLTGDFLLGFSNFLGYAAAGFALGYLYLKHNKNGVVTTLIHMAYNAFGIIMIFIPI